MPRNFQRSVRLDDDLKGPIDTLPHGSFNNLTNNLIRLFFEDSAVREKIDAIDVRFRDWDPSKPATRKTKSPAATSGVSATIQKLYSDPIMDASKDRAEEREEIQLAAGDAIDISELQDAPLPEPVTPKKRPSSMLDDLMPGL